MVEVEGALVAMGQPNRLQMTDSGRLLSMVVEMMLLNRLIFQMDFAIGLSSLFQEEGKV